MADQIAITLPRLVGDSLAARALVADALGDARPEAVTLVCRAVLTMSPGYAEALLDELANRGVSVAWLRGAGEKPLRTLMLTAGISRRVEVLRAGRHMSANTAAAASTSA